MMLRKQKKGGILPLIFGLYPLFDPLQKFFRLILSVFLWNLKIYIFME